MNGYQLGLIGAALVSHLTGIYIVGEEIGNKRFKPNITSVFFTLAVSILLIKQDTLPRSSCPFSKWFIKTYKLVEMLLMTRMALKYVWEPLCQTVRTVCLTVASTLCRVAAFKRAPLSKIPAAIASIQFSTLLLLIAAVAIFHEVIIATGFYACLKAKILSLMPKKPRACTPVPSCPAPARVSECEDDDDDDEEEEEDADLQVHRSSSRRYF